MSTHVEVIYSAQEPDVQAIEDILFGDRPYTHVSTGTFEGVHEIVWEREGSHPGIGHHYLDDAHVLDGPNIEAVRKAYKKMDKAAYKSDHDAWLRSARLVSQGMPPEDPDERREAYLNDMIPRFGGDQNWLTEYWTDVELDQLADYMEGKAERPARISDAYWRIIERWYGPQSLREAAHLSRVQGATGNAFAEALERGESPQEAFKTSDVAFLEERKKLPKHRMN